MRSMTLLLFSLLATTAFAQSKESTQRRTVPTPPPLTQSPKAKAKPARKSYRPRTRVRRYKRGIRRRSARRTNYALRRKRAARASQARGPFVKSAALEPNSEESKTSPSGIPEAVVSQAQLSLKSETELAQNQPPVDKKESLSLKENDAPNPMKASDRIPFMAEKKEKSPTAGTTQGSWTTVFGAVGIVLGLIFVGTWIVKKFGLFGVTTDSSHDDTDLELLATLSPRPGQTLTVVNFNGENLLLGSTDQGFTVLSKQTPILKDAKVRTFPKPVPIGSLLDEVESNEFATALETASRNKPVENSRGRR